MELTLNPRVRDVASACDNVDNRFESELIPDGVPKLDENQKESIYEEEGLELLAENKVASQIPTEFFEKQSIIDVAKGGTACETKYVPESYDDKTDYYNAFWRIFVQNERILNEI